MEKSKIVPRPKPKRPYDRQAHRSSVEADRQLETLSRWMDSVLRIPGLGWRIGLDAILGVVPYLGDTAASLVSLYILTVASRFGIPRITIARMALNIAIDWLIGSIPIVGDLFDIWWKSNQRNYELLRGRLDVRAADRRRSGWADWAFVMVVIGGLLVLLVGTLVLTWWLLSMLIHAVTTHTG